jgi:hypothetical protein
MFSTRWTSSRSGKDTLFPGADADGDPLRQADDVPAWLPLLTHESLAVALEMRSGVVLVRWYNARSRTSFSAEPAGPAFFTRSGRQSNGENPTVRDL